MHIGEEGVYDVRDIRLISDGNSPYMMSVGINENNIIFVTRGAVNR
jgi:hypothetical protein